ncbi:hypothetical protein PISMIDRAFT_679334 [Pisolithus microcarpus 441]|uniref:Uncharacterized protein n=1 Tax=Pisolithus microcarpus 441 TaxID=765257 RepID=A0A0C9ZBR1_9AGAM|nr:hypothetical protein PISMIDRAFT_679334 [Pisolithus microcarpus 441]
MTNFPSPSSTNCYTTPPNLYMVYCSYATRVCPLHSVLIRLNLIVSFYIQNMWSYIPGLLDHNLRLRAIAPRSVRPQ